jgi:hypothetical protein
MLYFKVISKADVANRAPESLNIAIVASKILDNSS